MTRSAAKSLNKPLLVLGIDRKLVGLAFLLAVTVGANDGGSKLAAVALFSGAVCAGPAPHTQRPEHLPGAEPGVAAEKSLRPAQAGTVSGSGQRVRSERHGEAQTIP